MTVALSRETELSLLLSELLSCDHYSPTQPPPRPTQLLDSIGSPSRTRTCDHSINSHLPIRDKAGQIKKKAPASRRILLALSRNDPICLGHGVTAEDAPIPLPSEGQGNVLTDLSIKNLMRPDKRPNNRTETARREDSGLYFVRQPSGAASWAVRYRSDGKPAKLTLGPYPALDLGTARRRAREAIGEIAKGKTPPQIRGLKAAAKAEQAVEDRIEDLLRSSSRNTPSERPARYGRQKLSGYYESRSSRSSARGGSARSRKPIT